MDRQIVQAQKRQKEHYDRSSNLSDSMRFKVGDDVWVPIPHVGVAKVTGVKGPVDVSIQNRVGRID